MIRLTLPYPPTVNHLYVTIQHKGRSLRVPSTESKKYKKEIVRLCAESHVSPIIGEVSITFRAYRPRRIGDLDGMFKAIFDGLSGQAYLDDKQISEIIANRYDDPKHPRVEIEIRALGLL
jgi:Holliday junction resolvase RusA-like endonuclease